MLERSAAVAGNRTTARLAALRVRAIGALAKEAFVILEAQRP